MVEEKTMLDGIYLGISFPPDIGELSEFTAVFQGLLLNFSVQDSC